jgi:DNA-binding transcriptional LysR family regulator
MNIDVMRTYCDLVEMGSFSKAGEANYISQSAVSQQLAKLERDLTVQLISRGGGLVAPTEAGREFYRGAKEILRRYEQLLGQVRSAADAIRGVLRIGTIYSAGFYVLDAYIGKFLQAHPEVNLHVEYTRSNRIYAEVINGQMDMGVVAYPEKHRSIEIIPLASEEMVMTCSPKHRLAGRSRIDLKDIDGEKFVGFEANIPTRRHIDRHLKREKISVDVVMEFDNIETVKRAVQIGAGISVLPKDSLEREIQYGDMACVRFREPKKWVRTIAVLRHRGKAPSPAERMFLTLLRKKG